MAKCAKGRMQSPCFETLHTAHVFTEIGGWTNHILAAEDGETKTVVNYFQRLEFQDGKRKLPTQHYHGSGRVHVHSLDYLQNVDQIGLERRTSRLHAGQTPRSQRQRPASGGWSVPMGSGDGLGKVAPHGGRQGLSNIEVTEV